MNKIENWGHIEMKPFMPIDTTNLGFTIMDDIRKNLIETPYNEQMALIKKVKSPVAELEKQTPILLSINDKLSTANRRIESLEHELKISNQNLEISNNELTLVKQKLDISNTELSLANQTIIELKRETVSGNDTSARQCNENLQELETISNGIQNFEERNERITLESRHWYNKPLYIGILTAVISGIFGLIWLILGYLQ
ncbi:MAG: hypothetical protein LBC71_04150 [Oscillospiraceae bacterium]|jgi:chromosome segregation ATPase|nr:hypothetical protein [Oscillospiraceae bacterium]